MPSFTETPEEVTLSLANFITTVELTSYSGDGKSNLYQSESVVLGLRIAPLTAITKGTSPEYEAMVSLLTELKEFTRRKIKKGIAKPTYKITVIAHNIVLVAHGSMDNVRSRIQYRDNITDFHVNINTNEYSITHGANAVRKYLLDTAIVDAS